MHFSVYKDMQQRSKVRGEREKAGKEAHARGESLAIDCHYFGSKVHSK